MLLINTPDLYLQERVLTKTRPGAKVGPAVVTSAGCRRFAGKPARSASSTKYTDGTIFLTLLRSK